MHDHATLKVRHLDLSSSDFYFETHCFDYEAGESSGLSLKNNDSFCRALLVAVTSE
jgi:hypothetical protein